MVDPRSRRQRFDDTIAALERHGPAWLVTSGATQGAHVTAVTAVWTGTDLLIATLADSPTVRNLDAVRDARRYVRLRPARIQAFRGCDEQRGRTIMRDGAWLA
jgi:hypothetical protein